MASPAPTARRHTLLPTVHILTTGGWFGAGLAVTALTVAGLAGTDPSIVYPAARLLAGWLVAPLAGASLASGLLLAATSRWGLFTHRWVTAKLAITVLLASVVTVLLVPRLGAMSALVTEPDAPAPAAGQRLPLALAPVVASLLLGVNVALAVTKPGGRRRTATAPRTPRTPRPPRAPRSRGDDRS